MNVDFIIHNAQIFTADATQPQAEAIAIKGHKILAVGSDDMVLATRTTNTRLLDAQQRTVMPGFIDSHFHLLLGSQELGDILLYEATSFDDLVDQIREHALTHLHEPWLVGRGVYYSLLPDFTLTRRQLDAIVSDRPLVIFAYDAHTAWANTEALRLAELLENGQTVAPNSEIVQADDGFAHGELREPGAYNPIVDLLPPPSPAQMRRLLKAGLAELAQAGVTSVHNMDGDLAQLNLYVELAQRGELTCRIYVPFDIKPDTPESAMSEAIAMQQLNYANLARGGCVKFFMDGVIETYTGLLTEDYAGQSGNRGSGLFSLDHFSRMATLADKSGLQIFVHAVGDAAVRRTLDGFVRVEQTNGRRDSRHRVEHIELIHQADVSRFQSQGVIASMQPAHAPLMDEGDPWSERIPQTRWNDAFAWQTLQQAGAKLALGSDWPVMTYNPLVGVHRVVTRQPWADALSDQRLSLHDTLIGYTRDAAYAEFQESVKGQLKAGYLADLVLLSDDIFAVPPERIARIYPLLTMCDGRVVYER
ncbi:amidohydrolase [Anaerolineales bacterium HSG6]|nr:amidohydrolase [Anaerolineales bacterium HSG6]